MIIILASRGGLKEIKIDADQLSPILQAIAEAAIGDGAMTQEREVESVFKINLGDIIKYISMLIK